MHRIDVATAKTSLPTPAAVGPKPDGYFTDGDPGGGEAATIPGHDWFNAVQEEIAYPITQMGLTLSKTDRTQLYQAMALIATQSLDYIKGLAYEYTSTTSVTVKAGEIWSDDLTTKMTLGSDQAVNLTSVGAANGIEAALAASKPYYLYLIKNTSSGTVATFASINGPSAVTLPTGYTKKRMIGFFPSNASSQVDPFYLRTSNMEREVMLLNHEIIVNAVDISDGSWYSATSARTPLIAEGLWTFFRFHLLHNLAGSTQTPGLFVRSYNDTLATSGIWITETYVASGASYGDGSGSAWLKTDNSGKIEYKVVTDADPTRIFGTVEGFKIRI